MITEIGTLSEVDPLFVSATNFHLTAGSPAVDAGVNTAGLGVTVDLDGTPRPQGAAYDIGAYEGVNSGISDWRDTALSRNPLDAILTMLNLNQPDLKEISAAR